MIDIRHIALVINDRNEIDRFYVDILELCTEREYQLGEDYAERIFGLKTEPIDVVLIGNERIMLELFIYADKGKNTFEHICIASEDRERIFSQARAEGYPVVRIEREGDDILFITDRSGNVFELKNS